MAQADLSSSLLELIEKVSQAETEGAAGMALLYPLITFFDMDQAALCEWKEERVIPLFAIDRTRKILHPDEDSLWLSKTLIKQATASMQPEFLSNETDSEDGIPKSVNQFSLRNIVCFPVTKNPKRVIFLASQRNPKRQLTDIEIQQFRTATKAAVLALHQQERFRLLEATNKNLTEALQVKNSHFLFSSPEVEAVLADASRFAPFNVSILVQGESGSGKEELAKEIHRSSKRVGKFIAINCANLTETLLESELFGHVKGAFTGAIQTKPGLIQEADGGTFFLDEIGELPFNLQAKLLRLIQERVYRPLGGTKDIAVDVRFLSASHKDLEQAVRDGSFREDLFYRITEATVCLPPLRARGEDVELLAKHFLSTFSKEFKLPERELNTEVCQQLRKHSWPGNVRELKNSCRTAVILSTGTHYKWSDFRVKESKNEAMPTANQSNTTNSSVGKSLKELTTNYEKSLVSELLKEPGSNQSTVADQLGISVRTLQRIIQPPSLSGNA